MEGTLKMQEQFLSVRQKKFSLYCCFFISLNVHITFRYNYCLTMQVTQQTLYLSHDKPVLMNPPSLEGKALSSIQGIATLLAN
jgi:hypothetical protein